MRLAKKLDFQLYIVQLELYQSRYGDYGGHPRAKIDPRQITGLDTEDELTSLEVHAIDMEGIPVEVSGFDFKGYDSEYLNGEIYDVEPRSEYDLFLDDVRTCAFFHISQLIQNCWVYREFALTKVNFNFFFSRTERTLMYIPEYDRTLFLLWPTTEDGDPVQIRFPPKYACWALHNSVSTSPSIRENVLVDSLRTEPNKNTKQKEEEDAEAVTRVLCKVACQWSDLSMLLTALETHHVAANLALIGLDNCVAVYRTFGWNALKDLCVILILFLFGFDWLVRQL
jgi:hypothetical protein